MNGDSHAAEVFNRKDAIRRPHLYKVACYDLFSHMILRCYHDAATAAKELNLSIREINVALLKGDKYAGIKWGYIRVDATPKLKKNGVHELRQIISIAAFEASVSKTGSNGRIRQETGNREIAYHPTNPDTFEDEIIFPFDGILDNASNVSTSSTANTGSRRGSPVSGDCIVEDSIVYWMDLPTDRNGSESITAKDEQNDVESLKNLSRHSTDSSGSSSSHKSLHSDDFPLVQLSNASGEEAVKETTLEPFDHQLPQNQVLSSSERSFPFYEPDPETAYYGSHFISREKPYYLRNALGFRLIVEAVQAMTPESLDGKKDMIHVHSIYKRIRMTHYDFFGGVTLKLSVIAPPIQQVIKECLTMGLLDRVSKSSSFPHSYVATKKGMSLDTMDIFPYNLVMTLSDLQQFTQKAESTEQPAPKASSSSFKSASSSSSCPNGSEPYSAIWRRAGTESSNPIDLSGLSSRLDIDEGREGDSDRFTKRIRERGRERDRHAVANASSLNNMINSRKDMDVEVEVEVEEPVVTEIVWVDQGPDEEQKQLTPERNKSAGKGDKVMNKNGSSHGAASGKSSDESRANMILPLTSSDLSRKKLPAFLKLGSVIIERNPYSHLCGALGCRIILEAIREIALKSDSQGEEDDADTVATTTSIQDSINEKYNDSLRRDSPFMSIAMKIIHKAKKNNLMTSALKTLMSDNLVDRRPSKFGRSYVYFLLKKGEKINVEKIFPYDIRKTLDLLISESATEYLDIETAKKYFSCGGEEEDAQRRPVGRHRTKVGANISGPLNEKKTDAMWPIDIVVSAMSTGASNRHRTPEIRRGKRRRDSELEEVEVEDDQNGDVEGNDTLGARNVLKSTQTPTVSMRVALAPANRAAKAEKIMNSDQPYGGVPLSDIALFFVTGALGCRLVVRALQVLTTYHSSSPPVDLIEIYSYIVSEYFSEFYQDVLLQFKLVDVRSAMTFALKRLEDLGLISCSTQLTEVYKITTAGHDLKPDLIFPCGPLKQFLQNAYEMRGGVLKWVGKGHDSEVKAQEQEAEGESEEEDCDDDDKLVQDLNNENENVEGEEVKDDNVENETEQIEDNNEGDKNNGSIHDEKSDAPAPAQAEEKVVSSQLPGPPATSIDRRSRSSSGRQKSTMLEQALGAKVHVPLKKQEKVALWLTASDENYVQHNDKMLDEFLSSCSESSDYFPKRPPESSSRFMALVPEVSDCPVGLRHLRDSAEERSLNASLSVTAAKEEEVVGSSSHIESSGTDGFEEGVTSRALHSEENRAKSVVDNLMRWEDTEYSGMDVEDVTASTPHLLRAKRSSENEANLLALLKQCNTVVCLPGSVIQVRPKGAPLMYVCVLGQLTKAVPADGTLAALADCHAFNESAPHSIVESEGRRKVEEEVHPRLGSEEEQSRKNTMDLEFHSTSKISIETNKAARDGNVMEDVEGDKEVLNDGDVVTACHPLNKEGGRPPEAAITEHCIEGVTPRSPRKLPIDADYLVAFDGSKNIKVLLADCRPLLGEDCILSVLREHSCTTVEDATPHLVKAATALLLRQWDVTDVTDYLRLFKRFDGELNKMYKKSQLRKRRTMREMINFHEYFKPLVDSQQSSTMQWLFARAPNKIRNPSTDDFLSTDHHAKSSSSKSAATTASLPKPKKKKEKKCTWHAPCSATPRTLPQLREAVTELIADYAKSAVKYYLLPRLMPLLMNAGWLKAKAIGNSKMVFIVAPWVAKPIAEGGVMLGQEIDLKGSREGPSPPVADRDYFYGTKRLLPYLVRSAHVPLDQMYANFSRNSTDLLTVEGSEPDHDVDLSAGWESLEMPRNSLFMAVKNLRDEDVVKGGAGQDPIDDSDDGGNDIDKMNEGGDTDDNSTNDIGSDDDRDDGDEFYRQEMTSGSNCSVSGRDTSGSGSSSSSTKFDPPVVCLDEDNKVLSDGGRYKGGVAGDQSDVCIVEFVCTGSGGVHPVTVPHAPCTQQGTGSAKCLDSGGQLEVRTSSDSAVDQIAVLSDVKSSAFEDSDEVPSKDHVSRSQGSRKSNLTSDSQHIPNSSNPIDIALPCKQYSDSSSSSRSDYSALAVLSRSLHRPLTASQIRGINNCVIPEFPRHTRLPFVKHVNAKAIFRDYYLNMTRSKPVVQIDLNTCISLCCNKRLDSFIGYAWKFYEGPSIDWSKAEVLEIEREQSVPLKSDESQSGESRLADGPAKRLEQQVRGASELPLPPASEPNTVFEYWLESIQNETVADALPSRRFTADEANTDKRTSSSDSVITNREQLPSVASGTDTVAESVSALLSVTADNDDASACLAFPSSAAATAHADPNLNRPILKRIRNRTNHKTVLKKIIQVQGIKPSMQIAGESVQAIDKHGVVVKSFANIREFQKETHLCLRTINRALEGKQLTAYGLTWRYYRGNEEDQDAPSLPESKRARLEQEAVLGSVHGTAEDESAQDECNRAVPSRVQSLLDTEIGAKQEDLVEMTEGDRGVESESNSERSGEEREKREMKIEGECESYEESDMGELEEGTDRESMLMSLVHPGEHSHLSDGISSNSNSLEDYSNTLDHPDGMSVDSIAYSRALRAITDIGLTEFDHDCMVQEDLEDIGFSAAQFACHVTE